MKEYKKVDALRLYFMDTTSHIFEPLFVPGSSGTVDSLVNEGSQNQNITPTLTLNQKVMQGLAFSGNPELVVLDELTDATEEQPKVFARFEAYSPDILDKMREKFMTPVPALVNLTELMSSDLSDHTYVVCRTNWKWYRFHVASQLKSPTVRYILDRIADWNDIGALGFFNSHDFLFNVPKWYEDDLDAIYARVRGLLNDAAYRDWRFSRIDPTWDRDDDEEGDS